MNKQRRADIQKVRDELANIAEAIAAAITDLESIRDEEQEAFDNLPEGLQESEQGERAQAAVDALEEAISTLDDLDPDDVDSALETAQE